MGFYHTRRTRRGMDAGGGVASGKRWPKLSGWRLFRVRSKRVRFNPVNATPNTPADADALGSLLTLADASKRLPGRPCLATVWRWTTLGILGRDGERVRLRAVRLGRRTYVTEAAIVEFGEALAAAHAVHDDPAPRRAAPRSRSAARPASSGERSPRADDETLAPRRGRGSVQP